MRMSCNGCRVLRKGCSPGCRLRPCLQWIRNPDSQANATLFLAKFYGRAGLLNLVNAGPDHLRPAIFRSLLYEACGRIVNPIYGSVGLLWSDNWQLCQDAVEAVLRGSPVERISSEATAATAPVPLLRAFDIRHVPRCDRRSATTSSYSLHRVNNNKASFKRCRDANSVAVKTEEENRAWVDFRRVEPRQELSHDAISVETTVEASAVTNTHNPVDLELTLGSSPACTP